MTCWILWFPAQNLQHLPVSLSFFYFPCSFSFPSLLLLLLLLLVLLVLLLLLFPSTEADPENYSNLKVNRERAINVHGALCSEPRLLHYSSLGVVPVRGFVEFMTPSFMKKWHGKIYNNRTRIEDLPTVQCLPVKLLLKEINVKHVDIWILDLEGAEESALRGTDFKAVHFNAVAMECDEHDISKNSRKTDILEANGFKCTLVERNCMCKHNDYVASAAAEKSTLRKWDGNKWSTTYTGSDTSAAVAVTSRHLTSS